MNQRDDFFGGAAPFQGDVTLRLRSIPANARIVKATATVKPLDSPFTQVISFDGNGQDFGAIRNNTSDWAEVDFHARRTLASVTGDNLAKTTLQADFGGGAYVDISRTGAVKGPPPDLPFNIDSDSGGDLPSLTVTKFKLTNPATGKAGKPLIKTVTIRAVPSNVTLRTGDLGPFWTHLGDMTLEETTPDFAAVLQGFLAKAVVENGFYVVPLILHSDSLGRLQVTVNTEFVAQQTAIPAGLKDVVLPYDLSSVAQPQADVLKINVPRNVRVVPEQTSARIKGAFEETRVAYGPTGAVEPKTAVAVPAGTAQAQPVLLDKDKSAAVTAVDLLIKAVGGSARLRIDLRADLAGKPDDASLLAAPAELALDPRPDGSPAWVSLPLPEEFRFQKNTQYWLVLQTLQGNINWSADPATPPKPGMQRTQDGGLSWRVATPISKNGGSAAGAVTGPLSGLFRLRSRPANFEVPIEVQTGSGKTASRVKLDRFAPLGRVDFAPSAEIAQALNASLEKAAQDQPPPCPQGEHIANGDFKQLHGDPPVPVEWELTSGSLDEWNGDSGVSIRSFKPDQTGVAAALSQVVPVSASCLYEFSFLGSVALADPDAVAEVFWLSQQCGLQRADSIPIQEMYGNYQVRHRIRVTAPAGAEQAEVRFRVPDGGSATVDQVSLSVTANSITNADLEVQEQHIPVGWTFDSGPDTPGQFSITATLPGATLENRGTAAVTLFQSLAVKAGESFTCDFEGAQVQDATLLATPQVKLLWLAADTTSAGPDTAFEIPENSSHTFAQGTVPEQAATAEVQLVLPGGSGLVVKKVSLQFSETQSIPLTFIAQAPGQIIVSDLRIGFERIPVPPPPEPPTGLCSPTPPGQIPGEEPCESSYCSCCGEKDSMTEATATVTPAKRPAMIGKCANCQKTLIRYGGKTPGPGETQVAFPAIFFAKPKPALPPLTAIAGIGKPREKQLIRAGIDSLEKLAAATPAVVAKAMAGVSIKHAPHFINEARNLLEAARGSGQGYRLGR
jgi:predicted flap endonuclease-1-like 5' DNA nuclease